MNGVGAVERPRGLNDIPELEMMCMVKGKYKDRSIGEAHSGTWEFNSEAGKMCMVEGKVRYKTGMVSLESGTFMYIAQEKKVILINGTRIFSNGCRKEGRFGFYTLDSAGNFICCLPEEKS